MNIIPASPYKTNSNAEIRVFDKIKESFANDNRYLAFHSLNLTKHEKKRFGEADFVIICEFGLFVFEVKGGKIIVDKHDKPNNFKNFLLKFFINFTL